MLRTRGQARAFYLFAGVLAVAAVLVAVLIRGADASPRATTQASNASPNGAGNQDLYGPPALATYSEQAPHVASMLNIYAVQGGVQGAASTPASTLPPVAPASFRAPVAAYKAYSARQLGLMHSQISQLQTALAAGDRSQAKVAWQRAYADYLGLGAVYLEGQLANLNQAIDGTPGGLPGGTRSPRFSGLHRLELGLWTGEPLPSLQPWASRLATDVDRLARTLPTVSISPLDYATRAHEILEDAVRDLLSGTDAPWSGAGVVGTAAGVTATTEVIHTLAPLLGSREGTLPVVDADLASLRSTLASLRDAHNGSLPTTGQLTQRQAEQLDASVGQALEGLAQVPGALETVNAPAPAPIPRVDVKIDP